MPAWSAKYWFEKHRAAAGRGRYRLRVPLPRAAARSEGRLALFISQSGETADTLAALRYCQERGPEDRGRRQRAGKLTIAREADVRAADPCGAGDRRRLDQGVHLPADRARLPGAGARRRRAARSTPKQAGELAAALIEVPRAPRRGAGHDERRSRRWRTTLAAGARRALSRPRHLLSDGARRGAQAQGDLLHPRRGLCRRRDEARADRADRRARAGHRHRPARRAVREDRLQHAGGRGARRQDHPAHRQRRHRQARRPAAATIEMPQAHPFVARCSMPSRSSSSPITPRSSRAPTSTSRATSPNPSPSSDFVAPWPCCIMCHPERRTC